MTKDLDHPTRTATTEEMVHAFRLTARYSGNAARAARDLGIREDRLRHWRRKHTDLYNKVAKQEIETVRQIEAEKHMGVAAEARDLESEVLTKVKDALANGDISPRDLGNLARNLATESGIHTDKALALTGDRQGGGIQVNINLPDMVRTWATKGNKFYDAEGNEIDPNTLIEGQAEEITDA
jgi:hypothetical protein